jgi:hypothetical protein
MCIKCGTAFVNRPEDTKPENQLCLWCERDGLKQYIGELYGLVESYLTVPPNEPIVAEHYEKLCEWFTTNKRPDGSDPLPIKT